MHVQQLQLTAIFFSSSCWKSAETVTREEVSGMEKVLKGTVIPASVAARAVRTASSWVLCASAAFPRKVQIAFPRKARKAQIEFQVEFQPFSKNQKRQMSSGVDSDRDDVSWSTSASTQTTTPPENFRYRVGTSVVCYLGTLNWEKGEIVKHNFEQPKGKFHPYQVRLEGGRLIFVPSDDDFSIRRLDQAPLAPADFELLQQLGKCYEERKDKAGINGMLFIKARECSFLVRSANIFSHLSY